MGARRATASARNGRNGVRSGVRRARISLARSLVPMIHSDSRVVPAIAAMASSCAIEAQVSIIAHSCIDAGAPAERRLTGVSMSCGEDTLGTSTASAPDAAIAARSSAPHGVSRPLARIATSRDAEAAFGHGGDGGGAGLSLHLGRDRILKVDDARSRRRAGCAPWQSALALDGGHVQRAAARAVQWLVMEMSLSLCIRSAACSGSGANLRPSIFHADGLPENLSARARSRPPGQDRTV
jgi:hypothetical protein